MRTLTGHRRLQRLYWLNLISLVRSVLWTTKKTHYNACQLPNVSVISTLLSILSRFPSRFVFGGYWKPLAVISLELSRCCVVVGRTVLTPVM